MTNRRIPCILGKIFWIFSIGLCTVILIVFITPILTPLGYLPSPYDEKSFYFCRWSQCFVIGLLISSLLYGIGNGIYQTVSQKTNIVRRFRILSGHCDKKTLWILIKIFCISLLILCMTLLIYHFTISYLGDVGLPLDIVNLPAYFVGYIVFIGINKLGLPVYGDEGFLLIVKSVILLQWFIIGGLIGLWLYKKDHPRNLGREKNLTPN